MREAFNINTGIIKFIRKIADMRYSFYSKSACAASSDSNKGEIGEFDPWSSSRIQCGLQPL